MSQFEFSTKEEREAWPVFRGRLITKAGAFDWDALDVLDAAASRFDAREKTCGIEPLSEEHFALGVCASRNAYFNERDSVSKLKDFEKRGLIKWAWADYWDITDRGREVLANLNAMCKVDKNG